eukprot:TRINITY_DN613_c0_g1_i13.p1 TRINITY_DN613_c0_g1~~TRINITY_DN613_c0_g1_i13.p1  ORF type:complete len:524 (+),score=89.22 TRINITY_DN613_c0_g1_i13:319-1890(+)
MSEKNPITLENRVNGQWKKSRTYKIYPDPLNGDKFMNVPDITEDDELEEFVKSINTCSRSGLHNPIKNVERYNLYGEVMFKSATMMFDDEVFEFFVKLIQRVVPKSTVQARAEVHVTRRFLQNFSGDAVRFFLKATSTTGDHVGQVSTSYRWPYGPVAIIAPFNFPLEISVLQLMGALMTGNKVLIKSDSKVSIVLEQFVRLLLVCGMPPTDVDLIHCEGPPMMKILEKANIRMLQFTGSSRVANLLTKVMNGRIKIEDAGFDWKILGPDVQEFDYVCWVSDQDAYALSGQKCSAQSIIFAHENWVKKGVFERLAELAGRRKLDDLTICPVLTWTNARLQEHLDKLLKIPGAKVLFGGKPLANTKIPDCYGSWEPTAVFVPIEEIIKKENFETVTTEVFAPFQVATSFTDAQLDTVIQIIEDLEHHLTAACVSNDPIFCQKVLGATINGTTYAGIRARTTGAPQNHWFGPCGDPRSAGIGTPEAITLVWTCHREIITDVGPISAEWKLPPPSQLQNKRIRQQL